MRILVTGAAGFIGYHTTRTLLDRGDEVIGLDNLNSYYDVTLKRARLEQLTRRSNFTFVRADIEDTAAIASLFAQHRPARVIHLAAQAGVRHSITAPRSYIGANIVGFLEILENCRHHGVEHLVFASSSSVYGANTKLPFSVDQNVDHPVNLYATTKKSNELMAHSYAHLYRLPVSGLRFFTVYGPWGRPDMSMFLFVQKIINGEPIEVYNRGQHARDFTYVDDVVDGIVRCCDRPAEPDAAWPGAESPATSSAPYRIYNIGNHAPVPLLDYIACIERAVGKPAIKVLLPLQPGDVPTTFADIDTSSATLGFQPKTPIQIGVDRFVQWYREYYAI